MFVNEALRLLYSIFTFFASMKCAFFYLCRDKLAHCVTKWHAFPVPERLKKSLARLLLRGKVKTKPITFYEGRILL